MSTEPRTHRRLWRPGRFLLLFGLLLVAGIGALSWVLWGAHGDARSASEDVLERPQDIAPVLEGGARARDPAATSPAANAGPTWRLRLRVRHHFDPGIPHAHVQARDASGRTRLLRTDADGRVALRDLPPGAVFVKAWAEGFTASAEKPFTREVHGRSSYAISLNVACTVEGSVVEAATGRPIVAAEVSLFPVIYGLDPHKRASHDLETVQATALSDARGGFRLEGVSKDALMNLRVLRVTAPGRRSVWKVLPSDAESRAQVVRLPSGGVLTGTVLLPDGRPAAGARVVAALLGSWGSPIGPDAVELPRRFTALLGDEDDEPPGLEDAYAGVVAAADAEGRFSVAGLGPRERYQLTASLDGWAPSEAAQPVVAPGPEGAAPLRLQLRRAAWIVARVVDELERPWPGVDVGIQPEQEAYAPDVERGRSNAAGEVVAEQQPLGDYEVRVHHPAFENLFVREHGDAAVPRPAGEGWVRQIVRAQGGTTVAHVRLAGRRPEPTPEPVEPDEDPPPRPPDPPRPATLRLRLAVPAGVEPPPRVSLHGHSQRNGGSTSTSATREWKPGSDGAVLVEWSQDPSWAFTLDVSAEGFRPQSHAVDPRGTLADLGTLMLDPGHTLDVLVRHPDGSPLADARVEAVYAVEGGSAPPPPPRGGLGRLLAEESDARPRHAQVARTDAQGRMRLRGLPPGEVRLSCFDSRCLPFDVVRAVPAKEPAAVVAARGAALRVLVVDERGHAFARARVRALGQGDERGSEPWARRADSVDTDVEGRVVLRVAPGMHTVEATASWRQDAPTVGLVVSDLVEGEEREVRLVVARP